MFGSQEEIINKQTFSMIVNIVGCNYLHESIISTFIESLDPEYTNRFRVISLLKPDQLMNTNESNKEPGFGLLNMTWMRKTLNYRPATVIVVYDLRNKSESVSLKDYENQIFSEISKIKKSDNYSFTNIMLLIYNNSNYTFETYSEDKDRPYNLKKVIDMKNIFYINGLDGLKNISKKIAQNVTKLSLNYYRTIKKNLKLKKNNSSETSEKVIKYNIKLGVISQIKNRKKNMKFIKYFEEAYNMLNTLDIKNYFYGSNVVKWNYLEIKSVADWLLFRIINLKSSDLQNSIQSIVNMFISHVKNYSRIEMLCGDSEKLEVKEENGGLLGFGLEKMENLEKLESTSTENTVPKLIFIEYFWTSIRYEFFAKFLEENFKSDFYIKNYLNFPGYHYMLSAFNLTRLLKFSNKFGTFNPNTSDKTIPASKNDSLKIEDNKFYGKVPKFFIQIDPLTRKETKFDEAIYLKYFINMNNLTQESLLNKLMDNLTKSQKLYGLNYMLERENVTTNTMTIYFNVLSVIANESYSKNNEKMKYLYKTFISSPNLQKFPKIFLKFLDEYNNILINENNPNNYNTVLNNLILISGVRNLKKNEEE